MDVGIAAIGILTQLEDYIQRIVTNGPPAGSDNYEPLAAASRSPAVT
jgi:hypothetical protein